MKKRSIILIAAGVLLSAVICVYGIRDTAYNVKPLSESVIDKAGIKNTKKLMIVAHPDDEVIWGGGHLMDSDYFVVCITNGRNDERKKEFQQVLESSGNKGIILDYPDKVLGFKDDWSNVRTGIATDLEMIIDTNNWETIVTHNPKGEYGHLHHKITNEIVTEIYEDKLDDTETELWYFGKYYKSNEISEAMAELVPISQKQLEYKENLEKIYESQSETIEKLSHMNKYEVWTKYAAE